MKITFLGTSSGVPTKTRNMSGLALGHPDSKKWSLIDCAEGTQQQLLNTPFSLTKLDSIFITHIHGDHCYGLPGLLGSAQMAGRTKRLTVFAPEGVEAFVLAAINNTQLYIDYKLEFITVSSATTLVTTDKLEIRSWPLSHRVPSFAYQFIETGIDQALNTQKLAEAGIKPGPTYALIKKGLPVTLDDGSKLDAQLFLFPPRAPRNIIVSGDNDTPSLLNQAASNANVLIHEATYTEETLLKVGEGRQHCSAKRIASFAQAASIPYLLLTHFSARYHDSVDSKNSIAAIFDEARQQYQGKLILARDLDSYQLMADGTLMTIEDNCIA